LRWPTPGRRRRLQRGTERGGSCRGASAHVCPGTADEPMMQVAELQLRVTIRKQNVGWGHTGPGQHQPRPAPVPASTSPGQHQPRPAPAPVSTSPGQHRPRSAPFSVRTHLGQHPSRRACPEGEAESTIRSGSRTCDIFRVLRKRSGAITPPEDPRLGPRYPLGLEGVCRPGQHQPQGPSPSAKPTLSAPLRKYGHAPRGPRRPGGKARD
jgi:hypothetical protein